MTLTDNPSVPINAMDKPAATLQFVYAFFRHGIRSPVFKPYPNDPHKAKYNEHFPEPPGSLTKIGKRIMYDVGKKLKERYGDFIGEYSDEKVFISSTNTNRTIKTALTVTAGLFPPSEPIFENLKWQPIPVWVNKEDVDRAFIYNDYDLPKLALEICPRYGKLIGEGNDLIIKPDLAEERQKLYELVQHHTGDPAVNSPEKLYYIWDTLQFESLNGLPLPSWATEPQPQYQNKPLYPDVMEPVVLDWFLATQYLNKNHDMLQFYSGPIFDNIHQRLRYKAKNFSSGVKVEFHFTHDTTLLTLLWALGLKKPVMVGPGDGIIFELHEEKNSQNVKTFYYNANDNHNVSELISPLVSKPCSLDDFIKATPGLTPQQWQEKCNS